MVPTSAGLVIPAGSVIEVRFRQEGDCLVWHKQTKSLKKLLQEWHIPPWQRSQVPLIYCNGKLAAVVGWAISDLFYQSHTTNACEIRLRERTPSNFDET
ncbi:MAG: tRNA lysidine(34) synthetase TilS [Silvanigrellaceae bacterium]|nr:tRNA lysidine(34) synthetase TilS [Silvanigrellaceae bacterium]